MVRQEKNALQQAEQLLREGKKQEAIPLLAGYLQHNPNSAQGWWLLGLTVPDPKRQIECMERVLRIDPASVLAQAKLEKLRADIAAPAQVPPFVESVSFDEPKVFPAQLPKQDSKSFAVQKTTPLPKTKRRVLQYVVLGVLACLVVAIIGFVAVMLLQGRFSNQSTAQPTAFTQISLPPTWTPQPTATRNATITPYPTITPVILPTLAIPPTSLVPRSRIGPSSGYYAPDFSLKNINDNVTTSLSDYEGQAVIIFFWATWCPYCKSEMPAMQMVYDAYKDKGLTILAVDVGENASLAGSYRDAHALTFPILNDAGRDVASTYQVTAFPSHFFVDPSGVISSINIGGLDYWALSNKVKGMLSLP